MGERVRNCVVTIKQDSGKLASGQRRSDVDGETLYEGPAFIRAPRRSVEVEAAPELRAAAELSAASGKFFRFHVVTCMSVGL